MTSSHSTAFDIDLYHLDAAYIAWKSGYNAMSAFELFTRSTPFGGGYMVAAGLEPAAEYILGFRFTRDQIDFIRRIKQYDAGFLELLRDFRFTGDILAVPEGEILFAHEPFMRVTAPFVEAMLLEAGLLRAIGISTLIATKAARITTAVQGRSFADFGFRRAHEPMWATRSAFIGGAETTSYVEAAQQFDIPASGTIPHAIVQAYPDELTAFREIAAMMPNYTLLIDTYDVDQGIDNAIQVAQEHAAIGSGHTLQAVRIDSGDLGAWAKLVKSRLVAAGMDHVKVLVSGDIDEYKAAELVASGAPIDGFGVGGNLAVGLGSVASGYVGGVIGAVYKLVWIDVEGDADDRMKIAGSKSTWPGRKQIHRIGGFERDVVALENEPTPTNGRTLLQPWMAAGELLHPHPSLREIRDKAIANLALMPDWLRNLSIERAYDVQFSNELTALRDRIIEEHR
ncbi:MAG: nicotinate phosphoribosyltransferase [Thermomicrobiales bacterium]|nr:nicotinate phosphoribosyltransferase [Thermomicrobiales bacterium]